MDELDDIKSHFAQSYFVLELIEYKYMFQKGCARLKEMRVMLKGNCDPDNPNSRHCSTELLESAEKNIEFLENANHSIQRVICTFRQHYTEHLKAHFDYVLYYLSETLKMPKPHRHTKIEFHLKCSEVLLSHFLQCNAEKLNTKTKKLPNLMEDIKNTIIDGTKERIPAAEVQERVKAKIESMLKICQSVCLEAKALKKSNSNEANRNRRHSHTTVAQKAESSQKVFTSMGKKMQQSLISKLKSLGNPKGTSKLERPKRGSKTDISQVQSNQTIDYPHIEKLAHYLQNFYPLSTEEQQFILDSVPRKFKDNSKAKISLEQNFKRLLDGSNSLTDDVRHEIESQIDKLTQMKEKRTLRADFAGENLTKNNLEIVKGIRDDYRDLLDTFHKSEMIDRKNFHKFCQNLELLNNGRVTSLLKKCIKGRPFETANDAMLKYLRDKMIVLEDLLITSSPKIDRMWREENAITKQQVIFLIKEQYVRDRILQAVVEMLLFDCMNILRHRTDLKTLWIKATNLFGGINLRNLLAHGNPLFKQIGLMLDPNDLPSEIVSKCLELIDDRKVIEAMCTLLEDTDGTRDMLSAKLRVREPGSEDLCNTVTRDEKWKDYACLLPRTSKLEMS